MIDKNRGGGGAPAPIPFNLATIVSGLLGYNFLLFVRPSPITRAGRLFLPASALERHFAVFLASMAMIVVVGFFLAAHVL